MKGIYLHIPFCKRKCAYCDFPSTEVWDHELLGLYVDALLADLCIHLPSWQGYTIYIGGGTPSILPLHLMERLLFGIKELLPNPEEFTFEANPESITREKLELLQQAGVTRLSMGVQSFNDKHLKVLGRIHTAKEAMKKGEMSKVYFDNLNIDLIFGIPGQSLRDLEKDIDAALTLEPAHLSVYSLTLEEHTPLTHRIKRGELSMPSEDKWLRMFHLIPCKLGLHGFRRYEISNFGKPGKECLHNLIYWENGEYLGVGASAVSHLGGCRLFREQRPKRYIERVLNGESPVVDEERLSPWCKTLETAVVGLRTTKGIDPWAIEERWGVEKGRLAERLISLEGEGLLEREDNRWRIPEKLLPVANEVMARILE